MGIVKDRGRYYWVKRVPKEFKGLVLGRDGQPVTQVRQALHTDSKTEALAKAAQVEAIRLAEWKAIAAGDSESAYQNYRAARELAQARGFQYRPNDELNKSIDDLIVRLADISKPGGQPSIPLARAVLGTVPIVHPDLDGVLAEYFDFTKTRHLQKSDPQKHRWRLPRIRAVANFKKIALKNASPPVDQISRFDVLKFRAWWSDRIEGGMAAKTANKEFGHLAEIFGTWSELVAAEIDNPFSKLSLAGKEGERTPSFSREWITKRLLKAESLSGLNEEAADIFLVLINTGLRPSEVTDSPLSDFRTTDNVPHIKIAPHGRELKVSHTQRDIPLVGVSLEAARRIVSRGGILRYQNKASGWSALVNRYLANNGLKETPRHTCYSLRHYVEDALLAAGVDDRVRADILGHKYQRPLYGDGGGLVGRRDALMKIAL